MLRTPAVTIIACLFLVAAACTQPTQAAHSQTPTESPRLSPQTEQRLDEACAVVADRVVEVIPQSHQSTLGWEAYPTKLLGFEGYMRLLGDAFSACLSRN